MPFNPFTINSIMLGVSMESQNRWLMDAARCHAAPAYQTLVVCLPVHSSLTQNAVTVQQKLVKSAI